MTASTPIRTLVTGAAGFLGAWVVRTLVARGHEVTALVRPGGARARLDDVAAKVRVVDAALDDAAAIDRALATASPDAVIHLAWYARPADYLTSPDNVASLRDTLTLVERALASGCRKLVVAGSCAEYAPSDRPRREDDAVIPSTLYAACKVAASTVARALADAHGAALAWARIFHLHGPGEDPARLIPWVARSLRAGDPVALSPGQQVRDHLHVEDVASALVALIGASQAFNVCSGEPVSLERVLRTVADVVGRPDLLRFGARPYAAGEVMLLAGDAARLRATGWRPAHATLRDSLAYLEAA